MSTYGSIRGLITKANPGIDSELIDGFLSDRYSQSILSGLSWKRLEGEFVIQAPPSYNVGTITANQGNPTIIGDGTGAWTEAMNGRMIRINAGNFNPSPPNQFQNNTTGNGSEYYQFTYVSPTIATLDRPYEGSTSSIVASAIDNGGTGYHAGDVFWVTGGNSLAQGFINTIGPAGSVTSYTLSNTGNNYSVATNVICTGGFGTGFTINITMVGGSSQLPYRIDQNVYVMPPEMRVLRGVRAMHDRLGGLEIISPHQANLLFGNRNFYGTPTHAVQTWDTTSDPPQMQIELLPVPASPSSTGATLSWVIDHIYDPALLDPNGTSATLLPWMDPSALKAGVAADCARLNEKLTLADSYEAVFVRQVKQMAMINAQQRGPVAIRMAQEYLGNGRGRRAYRRGPWREGWNG